MKSIFEVIFKRKLAEWESIISKSHAELVESKNEIRKLEEEILSLKQKIEIKNRTLSKLEDKIQDLKKSEDSMSKTLVSQTKTIDGQKKENLILRNSESSLKITLESLRRIIADNEGKIRLLRSSEESFKKNIDIQNAKIVDSEKIISQLKESEKSLKKTLESHNAIIIKKEDQILTLTESEKTLKETIDSKLDIIVMQEEEINQLKETEKSLREYIDAKATAIATVEAENRNLNACINNLKMKINEKEIEINESKKELAQLHILYKDTMNSANTFQTKLEYLTTQLSEKEEQLKALRLKYHQLEVDREKSLAVKDDICQSSMDNKSKTVFEKGEGNTTNGKIKNANNQENDNNEEIRTSGNIDENAEDSAVDESEISDYTSSNISNSGKSEGERKGANSESDRTTIEPYAKNRILRYPYRLRPTSKVYELQSKDFPIIENENIYFHTSRTINCVFNHRTNSIIMANDIFLKKSAEEISKIRIDLENAVRSGIPYLSCPCCENLLKISVRSSGFGDNRREVQFFSHATKNISCDLQRTSYEPSISYGDFQAYDSLSLKMMRSKLLGALKMETSKKKGVSEVKGNNYVISEAIPLMKRRLADVTAKYKNYDLVFEIVTPITNISKFRDREIFYYLNKKQVFWIFGLDSILDYSELTRAISKDILYAYNRQVFMFDVEAQLESERREELILKCNWLDENGEWHYQIKKQGKNGILISLDEITFDSDMCYPHYFATDQDFSRNNLERTVPLLPTRADLQEKLLESYDYDHNRKAALNEMEQSNHSVQAYFNGFHWGFKYGELIFIEPIFDSVPQIYGNYAVVEKNNKFGVVDRFGNIQLPPEYEKVYLLSNYRILYVSSSHWYLFGTVEPLTKYYPLDLINEKKISIDKNLYSLTIIHNTTTNLLTEEFYFIGSMIVKKDIVSGKWRLWQSEDEIENGELWDDFKLSPEFDIIIQNREGIKRISYKGEIANQTNYSNSAISNKENLNYAHTTKESKKKRNNKSTRDKRIKNNSNQNSSFKSRTEKGKKESCYQLQELPKDRHKSFRAGVLYEMEIASIETTQSGRLKHIIVQDRKGRKLIIFGDSLIKNHQILNAVLDRRTIWIEKLGFDSEMGKAKWRIRLSSD